MRNIGSPATGFSETPCHARVGQFRAEPSEAGVEPAPARLVDVELLLMKRRIALHDHCLLRHLFHFSEQLRVVGF